MVAVKVDPNAEVSLVLSRDPTTISRCVLKLSHPGTTDGGLLFKVLSSQPGRYKIRPKQGLITPFGIQEISILLNEKDREKLLKSLSRPGEPGLKPTEDKLRIDSCCVETHWMDWREGDDQWLTSMWRSVRDSENEIHQRFLDIRHVVVADSSSRILSRSGRLEIPFEEQEEEFDTNSSNGETLPTEVTSLPTEYANLRQEIVSHLEDQLINLRQEVTKVRQEFELEVTNLRLQVAAGQNLSNNLNDRSSKRDILLHLLVAGLSCLLCYYVGIEIGRSRAVTPTLPMAYSSEFVHPGTTITTTGDRKESHVTSGE